MEAPHCLFVCLFVCVLMCLFVCVFRTEFVKYRREKVLNVVDQRTGKKFTAKELQQYEAAEDKKEKSIIEVCKVG